MNEWKPLVARLSVFPVPSPSAPQPSALDVYRQICDADPDSFNKQSNPLAPSMAQGRRASLTLQCVSAPGRIDVHIAAAQTAADLSVPLIVDSVALGAELRRMAPKVGNLVPFASRIAAFVQFVLETDGAPSGNAAVLKVMPSNLRPSITNEVDFVFQINNPQQSKRNSATLNLLSKWSVDRLTMQTLLANSGQFASGFDHIVASVAFDHNNAPSPSLQLGRDLQGELLLECLEHISRCQKEYGLNVAGV